MLRADGKLGLELARRAIEPSIIRLGTRSREGRPEVPRDDRPPVLGGRDVELAAPPERQMGGESPHSYSAPVRQRELDLTGPARRSGSELLSGRKSSTSLARDEHGERVAGEKSEVAALADAQRSLALATDTADACGPTTAQPVHVVEDLVDVSEGRPPPAAPGPRN
jgi:hypothetical protein